MSWYSKLAAAPGLFCTPLLACAAFACSPAFACGFHDQSSMLRGMMNWVYPDSLHVSTAVWMAQRDGRLDGDELAQRDDLTPEARNGFNYLKATFVLRKLTGVLAEARGDVARPNLAVVLLGPMLWSRYEIVGSDLRLSVHVDGPTQGDVVVVTEASVIEAIVAGRIPAHVAIEQGMIKLYGKAADSRTALDWLVAARLRTDSAE